MEVVCKLVISQLTDYLHDGVRVLEVRNEGSADVSMWVKPHVQVSVVRQTVAHHKRGRLNQLPSKLKFKLYIISYNEDI